MNIEEIYERIEQYTIEYKGSLEENKEILKDLIYILADLQFAVVAARNEIPKWSESSQILTGKIMWTALSIHKLCSGFDLGYYKSKETVHLIDYSSIYVLLRALIENYVTLCYIHNNNLPEEERYFRFKIWELSGLIARQNLKDDGKSEKIKKIKEEEKKLIDVYLNDLQTLPEFKNLEPKLLEKLKKQKRNGQPRMFKGWEELINESNLRKPLFQSMWTYYSSFAHSELGAIFHLSHMSLNAKNKDNINRIRVCTQIAKMIVSLTIDFYRRQHQAAEEMYQTLPSEIMKSVNIWASLGGVIDDFGSAPTG